MRNKKYFSFYFLSSHHSFISSLFNRKKKEITEVIFIKKSRNLKWQFYQDGLKPSDFSSSYLVHQTAAAFFSPLYRIIKCGLYKKYLWPKISREKFISDLTSSNLRKFNVAGDSAFLQTNLFNLSISFLPSKPLFRFRIGWLLFFHGESKNFHSY